MNLTAEEMNVEFEKEAAEKGDGDVVGEKETDKEKGKAKEKEGDFRKGGKV